MNETEPRNPDWQSLAQQVQALAASQKRWRRASLALFLILAILITIALVEMFVVRPVAVTRAHGNGAAIATGTADHSANGILVGQGLTLVDQAGQTRVSMGMTQSGETRLDLLDATGVARTSLKLTPDGTPSLMFIDDQNRQRALVGTDANGLPLLVMSDVNRNPRVTLALPDTAGPAFILSDEQGQPRTTWALMENGWPKLSFLSPEQQPWLSISAQPQRTGIMLWDSHAKPRASFQLTENGDGQLQFYDSLGSLFYFAP